MKKLSKKIREHKVVTSILAVCLVGVIGVGCGFGIHQAKVANTQKALLLAQDGYVDAEELAQIGDLALGEEIVAPDGSTVIITKDENGNYQTTTVKDSSGNSTGAVVPEPLPTPDGGSPSPVHQHVWVAHTATRQVEHTSYVHHDAVTQQVMVSPGGACCNTCGLIMTTGAECSQHVHETGHGATHSVPAQYETQIVQAAYDEPVTTYTTETYVDYYYCSECGERQ